MNLKPLDVNTLIKQVIYPLSTFLDEKIRLQTCLSECRFKVLADWEHLCHAIVSLIEWGNNAARDEMTITVETRLLSMDSGLGRDAGCAMISITTTGKGDLRETVTVRDRLSRVYEIIRSHNGLLRTLNQEGMARFNIYLPLLPDCI